MGPNERIVLLALLASVLLALLLVLIFRLRVTPMEKERRRRTRINVLGRMGDGMLTDVNGDILYYSYSVHGVDYTASQDISEVRALVPGDAALIIGPVTLKYLIRNPANSIIVCENWSGLRIRKEIVRHEEVR